MSTDELKKQMEAIDWWHSIDLGPTLGVTPGREPNPRSRDSYMNIPWGEMKGKAVLDVGAWDGLYSFEAEKAGAAYVVALEPENYRGFLFAKKVLNSHVVFSPHEIERLRNKVFHFALFLGVLYHLKNPYAALEQLYKLLVPGGLLILETALTEVCAVTVPPNSLTEFTPILEFVPGERDGDPTNWNYPNRAWVEAALTAVGFEEVKYQGGAGNRAAWHARVPK